MGSNSRVREREMGCSCSGTSDLAVWRAATLSDGNEGAWEIGVTGGIPSAEDVTD
jgi:hypothetical protein